MIQHIVLFRFPQVLPPDQEEVMRSHFRSWVTEIGETKRIRFGSSIFTDWSQGYQYLLYLEFGDLDAVNRYLQHPAHLKFGAWAEEHGAQYLVFNYELNDQTQILP